MDLAATVHRLPVSRQGLARLALPALLVMFSVHSLSAQTLNESAAARIDQLFEDLNSLADPGCSVGVRVKNKVVYARGFGAANVSYGAPNTPRTAFEIASGSKSFTSACVALLMDQGKFGLDDDVRQLLPELRLEKPVLVRHLLRCESGVWAQFHIMPIAGWDNVPFHSPYSKEDMFTVLCGQRKLPFEPGTDFQYGSGDTFLLGMVVERVTGKPLAQFAKEHLFEPLGMTRTWYLEDPGQMIPNRAVGHWKPKANWLSGKHSPAVSEWHRWQAGAFLGGGGSILTTVEDLLKWSRVYEQRILPRGKFIDEFTGRGSVAGNRFVLDLDAYLKHVNKHAANPPPGQYRGAKRIQTTGGYWGFTACLSHFPEHDTTIVCLSNHDGVAAFVKARDVADIVLRDVLAPAKKEPEPAQVEGTFKLTAARLAKLAGPYRLKGNNPIWEFKVDENTLKLIDGWGGEVKLEPLSPSRFKPVGKSPLRANAVFEFKMKDAAPFAHAVDLSSVGNGIREVNPFKRITRAPDYSPEVLRQFAGTFLSKELGAVYHIRERGGQLEVRVGSRRWEPMRALEPDEFSPLVKDPHNTRFIRFLRDANGIVDGFSIGFWRIHGVQFDKLNPTAQKSR